MAEATTGVNEPNKVGLQTPVLPETLHQTDMVAHTKRAQVLLDIAVRDRLNALKSQTGFKNYNALVNYMIEINRNAVPVATIQSVLDGTKPILIVGDTGSGKTWFMLHDILGYELLGNCFVIDSSDEYKQVEKVGLDAVFAMKWEKDENKRVRFVPDPLMQNADVRQLLSLLNTFMKQGKLKRWVVIVEEGHRYAKSQALQNMRLEARKAMRKLIIVTTDPTGFQGTPALKPKPWQP